MADIYLEVKGDGSAFSPKTAHIILGDHGRSESGDIHLSARCMSPLEVEQDVARLKKKLDKLVVQARRDFKI